MTVWNFNLGSGSTVFFKMGFTPCKAEQPLQGMELPEREEAQEKEAQKAYSIQEIFLERTYRETCPTFKQ